MKTVQCMLSLMDIVFMQIQEMRWMLCMHTVHGITKLPWARSLKSHWSSEGCVFHVHLGFRNCFSETWGWWISSNHLWDRQAPMCITFILFYKHIIVNISSMIQIILSKFSDVDWHFDKNSNNIYLILGIIQCTLQQKISSAFQEPLTHQK